MFMSNKLYKIKAIARLLLIITILIICLESGYWWAFFLGLMIYGAWWKKDIYISYWHWWKNAMSLAWKKQLKPEDTFGLEPTDLLRGISNGVKNKCNNSKKKKKI